MCQATCGPCRVACVDCGAGYYEDEPHTCKPFESFESWDARLQARAAEPLSGSDFMQSLQRATREVAGWDKWKRRYVWSDQMRHTKREVL
jgi:hypothetical protein